MSAASTTPVTVEIATSPDEAINGQDFFGTWRLLTLAPGETELSVEVQTLEDSETESDEAFGYRIFKAQGATIVTDTASVLIRAN